MTVKKVSEISRKDFNGGVRGITLWDVCARNLFPPISFLYQREVFEGIGYYDESMPVLGDWEFNLRFLQHYDIVLVPEHLAFYHHRVPEDSSDYANTVVGAIDTHETYQTYMRNKLLRDDMEQGKVGVGYLINLSRDLFSTQAKFDYDHHMHAENHKILMKQGKNMHKLNEHVASHHRATTATLEKSQKLLKENNTLLNVQKEKVAIIYHRIDKLVGLLRPFRKKQNQ